MKAAGKPYRTGRGNEEYEKGYEGGGEGVIIGTGKGGGGGGELNGFHASNKMVPAQKKRFVREIKGKTGRSLDRHMHKINKEHASEEVTRF